MDGALLVYMTGHFHSKRICPALLQGGGKGARYVPPEAGLVPGGPIASYGILRGTGDVFRKAAWVGRPYYYVDHGYTARGHAYDKLTGKWAYNGLYRVCRNAFQWNGIPFDCGSERADWQRIRKPKPWRKSGRHIVVCPMSPFVAEHMGIEPKEWLAAVMSEISLHTDRPITVKPKESDAPLSAALADAWCMVAHTSTAAIEAVLAGVPTIVLATGTAMDTMAGHDLSSIEAPPMPDNRDEWRASMAWQQWTLDEIADGKHWPWTNIGPM